MVGDVGEANTDITQVIHVLEKEEKKWEWLGMHLVELTSGMGTHRTTNYMYHICPNRARASISFHSTLTRLLYGITILYLLCTYVYTYVYSVMKLQSIVNIGYTVELMFVLQYRDVSLNDPLIPPPLPSPPHSPSPPLPFPLSSPPLPFSSPLLLSPSPPLFLSTHIPLQRVVYLCL